jgi:heme a synthase
MLAHRFALGTLGATLVLLVVGGLVSGTGSSLACPEPWFICHGSMLPEFTGGVEYEHTHRLVAMLVGLLTLILAGLLWRRRDEDRPLAWMGIGASGLVIFQGILGGLTVQFDLPTAISSAHLATAMLYLSLVTVIAVRSRRLAEPFGRPADASLVRFAGFSALAVYLQVALGGVVRHTGAGLVCPDLPFCNGAAWPVGQHPAAPIHMLHRYAAVVVSVIVVWAAIRIWRASPPRSPARLLAVASGILLAIQFTLGVLSVTSRLDLIPVTAHLGVGALLLATSVAAWTGLRLGLGERRGVSPATSAPGPGVASPPAPVASGA